MEDPTVYIILDEDSKEEGELSDEAGDGNEQLTSGLRTDTETESRQSSTSELLGKPSSQEKSQIKQNEKAENSMRMGHETQGRSRHRRRNRTRTKNRSKIRQNYSFSRQKMDHKIDTNINVKGRPKLSSVGQDLLHKLDLPSRQSARFNNIKVAPKSNIKNNDNSKNKTHPNQGYSTKQSSSLNVKKQDLKQEQDQISSNIRSLINTIRSANKSQNKDVKIIQGDLFNKTEVQKKITSSPGTFWDKHRENKAKYQSWNVNNMSDNNYSLVNTNVRHCIPTNSGNFATFGLPIFMTVPPPPPPPPPPPLPSSPPPSPPPPPPPLNLPDKPQPLNIKRNISKLITSPKKKNKSNLEQFQPKSPPRDLSETDYVDLLLEYKQIQQQLASITRREQQSETKLDPNNGNTGSVSKLSGDNLKQLDDGSEAGEIPMDLSPLPGCESETDEKISAEKDNKKESQTNKEQEDDDDDDLNLLELRLAALASAARATRKAIEEEDAVSLSVRANSPKNRRASPRKPSGQTRQKVSPRYRRSSKSPNKPSAERYDNDRRFGDTKGIRNDIKMSAKRSRDRNIGNVCNEAKKIRTLDDPEERYQRFMKMVSLTDPDPNYNMSTRTRKSRRASDSQLKDNYDEVAMEIASDVEATDTVIEVEPYVDMLDDRYIVLDELQAPEIEEERSYGVSWNQFVSDNTDNYNATYSGRQQQPAVSERETSVYEHRYLQNTISMLEHPNYNCAPLLDAYRMSSSHIENILDMENHLYNPVSEDGLLTSQSCFPPNSVAPAAAAAGSAESIYTPVSYEPKYESGPTYTEVNPNPPPGLIEEARHEPVFSNYALDVDDFKEVITREADSYNPEPEKAFPEKLLVKVDSTSREVIQAGSDVTEGAPTGSDAGLLKTDCDKVDNEVELLRAQLLQSLAQKKLQLKKSRSRSGSPLNQTDSPTVSPLNRSGSPFSTTYPVGKKNEDKSSKQRFQLPTVQPVVIQTGDDDTSESEGESSAPVPKQPRDTSEETDCLLGSLDAFLKEARMSVKVSTSQPIKPEEDKSTDSPGLSDIPAALEQVYAQINQDFSATIPEADSHKDSVEKDAVDKLSVSEASAPETNVAVTQLEGATSTPTDIVQASGNQEKEVPTVTKTMETGAREKEKTPVVKVKSAIQKKGKQKINAISQKQAVVGRSREMADLETQLEQERNAVKISKTRVLNIQRHLEIKKATVKRIEMMSQKLREQLQAAEKVMKKNILQIREINQKNLEARSELAARQNAVRRLQTQLTHAGKKLLLTSSSSVKQGKRPISVIQRTKALNQKPAALRVVQRSGERTVSKDSNLVVVKNLLTIRKKSNPKRIPAIKPGSDMASEKNRLLELRERYAEMIKKFKENQGLIEKRNVVAGSVYKQKSEPIKTEEKMEFSVVPEVDMELADLKPRRRKSLIDLNSSMKPVLEEEVGGGNSNSNQGKENVVDVESQSIKQSKPDSAQSAQTKPIQFSIPSGKHLEKLSKVFQANMMRLFPQQNPSEGLIGRLLTDDTSFTLTAPLEIPDDFKLTSAAARKKEGSTEPKAFSYNYKSALLSFKSYRFSPYYRTREKLTVPSCSFSHKINAKKILCPFDMAGTCNDDKCKWQHQKDYTLSKEEVLLDLVSFSSKLAGIQSDASVKERKKSFDDFVENFRKQNGSLTYDQQCLLLASRVNDAEGHVPPHTICTVPREWKPIALERESNVDSVSAETKEGRQSDKGRGRKSYPDLDNVINEQDVRYWMISSQELQDMETAVLENPQDVNMWIKLAYKKLREPEKNSSRCLDHALNVLARGLEANRNMPDLWLHYIKLYQMREDHSDILTMCSQALQYAPSYDLYWKYIELSASFTEKCEFCHKANEFLCSDQFTETAELRSHHMLEMLLFQASLNIITGQFKNAVQVFQRALQTKGKTKQQFAAFLNPGDKVSAWLAYIHLAEFKKLPSSLFDPRNGNPGHIVNKDIVLPWTSGGATKLSPGTVKTLLSNAVKSCTAQTDIADVIDAILPLYTNLISFDVAAGRFTEAIATCTKLVESHPNCIDLWVTLVRLEHAHGNKELVKKAIEQNSFSAELYYTAADLALKQGNSDEALVYLEDCVIQFFCVDRDNPQSCDPNLLYCKVLDQFLPLTYTAPALKPDLSAADIENQKCYLWINYSLLLDLQGENDQVVESFETASTAVKDLKHAKIIWLRYLRYLCDQLDKSVNKLQDLQGLRDVVDRCLLIMPTKLPLPNSSSQYWLDYSFHNYVIMNVYMPCLPQHHWLTILQKYAKLMPANVQLIQRLCSKAQEEGQDALARGVCLNAIKESSSSLSLWKIFLVLCNKVGDIMETKKAFLNALKNIPLNLIFWKNWLLTMVVNQQSSASAANDWFTTMVNNPRLQTSPLLLLEVINGSRDGIDFVLDRCRRMDTSLDDYLKTLLP